MKINWRIRLKNPVWWAHIIVAMLVPVIGYYGLNVRELTSWNVLFDTALQAIRNPYVIGCTLVAAWNAVYDPTSKGLCDCKGVLAQKELR